MRSINRILLPLVPILVACTCPLIAQKTSTWTGKGGIYNEWSNVDNWDTPEDPNGGDTVIIPPTYTVLLDVDRSVGLLDIKGAPSKFSAITGSANLTVQNGVLWQDAGLFTGSGTFVSNANSAFSETVAFGSWDVTLGGTINFSDAYISVKNVLNLNGTISSNKINMTGEGTCNLNGSHTITAATRIAGSLFIPETLNITGTLNAHVGIVNLSPDNLTLGNSAVFQTGADGEIIINPQNVTIRNTTFMNEGETTISDRSIGSPKSTVFSGTNQSAGSQPVVLSSAVFDVEGARFEGNWLMRSGTMDGRFETSGAFEWEGGILLSPGIDIYGGSATPFLISLAGVEAKELKGRLVAHGKVIQEGSFTLLEGSPGSASVAPVISLLDNAEWEIRDDAGIISGSSTDAPPTLSIGEGTTFLKTEPQNVLESSVSLKTDCSGTIKTTGGKLKFTGNSNAFGNIGHTAIFDISGSTLRLSGTSRIEDATINFSNGGILELRERSPGTTLEKLTGTGNGEVHLGVGAILIHSFNEIDMSASGDALFSVFRDGSSTTNDAIIFKNDDGRTSLVPTLTVKGNFIWKGRGIRTLSDTLSNFTVEQRGNLINDSGSFMILPGTSLSLNDVQLTNLKTLQIGQENSPVINFRRSEIRNFGLIDIRGDGDFMVSGDSGIYNDFGASVIKSSGTSLALMTMEMDNRGTVESQSGILKVGPIAGYNSVDYSLDRGKWVASNGGILRFGSIIRIETLKAGSGAELIISGSGSEIQNSSNANIFRSGLTVENDATIRVEESANVDFGGDLTIAGTLAGDGTVTAPTVTVEAGGLVSPGQSPGTLNIAGSLNMAAEAQFLCEISPGMHDQINVSGDVTLSGVFRVNFVDGYTPSIGEAFTVLTASSVTGSFDQQYLADTNSRYRFAFENTGTSIIATVIEANYTDYEQWRLDNFLPDEQLDPALSGRDGSASGDGVPNVFKFLSGNGARDTMRGLPVFTEPTSANGTDPSTITVEFYWPEGVESERYYFESSTNLANWNTATHTVQSESVTNGIRKITAQVTGNDVNSSLEFFRMQVVPAP